MKWPIIFAMSTALFWGLYGPVLGMARSDLKSPFKPYVAIGIAYLIWGVLGGIIGMLYKGDNFDFMNKGSAIGLIAGSLGAFGAFTLTLAMFTGGASKPFVVMPIVFGGAVTVSAIYSALTIKPTDESHGVSPMLWVGIAGILVCTVIVAYFTPHAPAPGPKSPGTAHAPASHPTPSKPS